MSEIPYGSEGYGMSIWLAEQHAPAMSDLVGRLRATTCDREPFTDAHKDCICRLTSAAAHEIEQLRSAVLAEREACAKIAKEKAGHMQMMLDELMQLPPQARISHTFLAYQARLMDCLSIERDIRARSTENGGET